MPCTVTDGTSSLLQVDKVERHHENPLGVFGKCGQSTPLVWVAIIAYLTVARIKADYKSLHSITEVATLIRISAMERTDLRTLITKRDVPIISNQNVKERTLFDNI